MTLKKVSIDRNKWGSGALNRTQDGRMCCLGHVGLACGIPAEEMLGKGFLDLLSYGQRNDVPKEFGGMQGNGVLNRVADIAVEVNDDGELSLKEKEERLKILFRSAGVRLTFKGKAKYKRSEF